MEFIDNGNGTFTKVYNRREKRKIAKNIKKGSTGDDIADLRNIFVYCEAFGIDFEKLMSTHKMVPIAHNIS
jgi:hypothetical protein